jgi:NAD dependent epimerase/dehydratase family enzyme
MDASGGTFVPLKLAWSVGLGATLGDGSQRMPMTSLRDYLDVVQWACRNRARFRAVQRDLATADDQCRIQ